MKPTAPATTIVAALAWCLIVALSCRAAAGEDPVAPRLRIHAWIGVDAAHTSVERYRELADAGFTSSFSPFPDIASALRALDAAQAAGIGLFVQCPELREDTAAAVRRLRGHPALAGYHLRDEPGAADFADLGAWVRAIAAVDPEHPCYINLLPTYATATQLGVASYRAYLDGFLAAVPTPFLSFDYYPNAGARFDQGLYADLEAVADAARTRGIPMWAFYQAVRWNDTPPRTLAMLRVEAFSALVHGAQCIQVFTWWTPEANASERFRDAPIGADGARTPTYDLVRRVNGEIVARSRVFAGCTVESVRHAGDVVPPGTTAFAADDLVANLAGAEQGVVVARLRNGADRYLALVNKDVASARTVTIGWARPTVATVIRADGTEAMATAATFAIEAGDVLVLRLPR